MKISKIVLALGVLCLAGVALAGEEVKTKITIAVVDDASDDDIRIELDSDELGFNLYDMQEGENRSVIDKSGRTILVTREADGFSFDVDGETIKMPAFDGDHHGMVWVDADQNEEIDVHVMKEAGFVTAGSMDGVMIMSGKPIDEATQQAIRSLLESAGHSSDVQFIDHEGPHVSVPHGGSGPHSIKVIKKHVEITQ